MTTLNFVNQGVIHLVQRSRQFVYLIDALKYFEKIKTFLLLNILLDFGFRDRILKLVSCNIEDVLL